jgi:DNA topoisomerase-1
MSKILVVVESPGKTAKISSYLGPNYIVKASFGHIMDLEKSKTSIDINNNFEGKYIIIPEKMKIVNELKNLYSKCGDVLIASDLDREGEAIAQSIATVLNINVPKRMIFNEITKKAIQDAINNIKSINYNMVYSQRARRFLDRLMGFELSPLLSKSLNNFLTAGRVQSVVVKLIVEREKEINNFSSELAYYLSADFDNLKCKGYIMSKLTKPIEGILYESTKKEDIIKILEKFKTGKFSVYNIYNKQSKHSPPPPFITSSLQQDASTRLGYPIKLTMDIAQKLYEGGYITYMRTDSPCLSNDCLNQCQKYIKDKYGEKYYQYKQYSSSNNIAQEAHEAIRPTDLFKDYPNDENQQKLYKLILKRTLASQMQLALIDTKYIQIIGKDKTIYREYFEGTIKKILFDGYLKVYNNIEDDEKEIFKFEHNIGDNLEYKYISGHQEATKPKSRYQEANLVRKLEKLGIGRPSTYASIISKIQERSYVEKKSIDGKKIILNSINLNSEGINESNRETKLGADKNKLVPTESGIKIVEYLENNFTKFMNYGFTASMEEALDDIASGKKIWYEVLRIFYNEFHPIVEKLMGSLKITPVDYGILLGKHPKSGFSIYAVKTKNGNCVRMIEFTKTGKTIKNQTYASIDCDPSLVTFEKALNVLKYPEILGKFDDRDITLCKGQYGLYIRHGTKENGKNYQWKSDIDPSLDEAIKLISDKNENLICGKYELKNGPYGPYIIIPTSGKTTKPIFLSIKDIDPNTLTDDNIKDMLANSKEKKKYTKKFTKKNN